MSAGPGHNGLSQKELERSDCESSREPYTSLSSSCQALRFAAAAELEQNLGSVLWRAIYGQEWQCYYSPAQ
jgi:hypothetical protein